MWNPFGDVPVPVLMADIIVMIALTHAMTYALFRLIDYLSRRRD